MFKQEPCGYVHLVSVGSLEADDDGRKSRVVANIPILYGCTVTTGSNRFERRVCTTLGCITRRDTINEAYIWT